MRKLIQILLLLLFPFFSFSQKWKVYSDSVFIYFKNGNLDNANKYVHLADNDLLNSRIVEDTIYADYLYRKGITLNENGNFDKTIFNKSLSIWSASKSKNYFKIMKIHYFLALGFKSNNDFENAHKSYLECYRLNIEHKITLNTNFLNSLYFLCFIEFNYHKNYLKAKEYSEEYIRLNKDVAFKNYDIQFAYAYRWQNDDINYGKTLIEFEKLYFQENQNNENLLFKIYFELFTYYYKVFKLKEIIKYGELSLNLLNKLNFEKQDYIKDLYPKLIWAFHEIGDIINTQKYEEFYEKFNLKMENTDYLITLDFDLKNKLTELFKKDFLSYESTFIITKDYNNLFDLYYRYIRNYINGESTFKVNEILEKIEKLSQNIDLLHNKNKIKLALLKAEILSENKQYEEALKICNSNLEINEIEILLEFYKTKFWSELGLNKLDQSQLTVLKSYEIFKANYEENNIRAIPIITRIIESDRLGNKKSTLNFIQQGIRIINLNNLEKMQISTRFWHSAGEYFRINSNSNEAIYYYEKSIVSQESQVEIDDKYIYYDCLVKILEIKSLNGSGVSFWFEKLKSFATNNPKFFESISDELNLTNAMLRLKGGMINDNLTLIEEALRYFELYYNSKKSNNDADYISYSLCKYLKDNNISDFLKLLPEYERKWGEHKGSKKLLYLMKYRIGEILNARNKLLEQIENDFKISRLNQSQMSFLDIEIQTNKYIELFEYLKNHLNGTDLNFLKKYIYLESKLRDSPNHNIKSYVSKEAEKYLIEYQSNKTTINKSLENNSFTKVDIERLKSRNSELERILFTKIGTENISKLNFDQLLGQNNAIVEIIRINNLTKKYPKNGFDLFNEFTDSITYGAIIIKKNDDPKFILIDNTNLLEKRYILDFNTKIQNKNYDNFSYKFLFEKIDNELKGIDKIYFISDGVYNTINIESIYNPIKKQYLVDYLNIEFVQNLNSIFKTKELQNSNFNKTATLIGNPSFKLSNSNASKNDFGINRNINDELIRNLNSNVKISQLPGTQNEIDKIQTILKETNYSIQTFSNLSATEENLKSIQTPKILHIATHGYFLKSDTTSKAKKRILELFNDNYKNDSYLQSGLLFSGSQNTLNGDSTSSIENGIFTGEEAKNLNLKNTELVVLSACETGMGDNEIGIGVMNLQRAFMIAGAKSVVMSLWSVSDEKTQELMTLFYTYWISNHLSKADALHKAKLDLKKKYPEPFYWAGFILVE